MTEREYINATELTRVRDIQAIFNRIVPVNSETISVEQFQKIGEMLYQWSERLEKKVKIK